MKRFDLESMVGVSLSIFLCVSPTTAFAQNESGSTASQQQDLLQSIEQTTPIPADNVPASGTFYSAQHSSLSSTGWPPLPGNINNLPVWNLGDGIWLLDDTGFDYSATSIQAGSMMMAAGVPFPGGSGGGGTNGGGSLFGNYTQPDYGTNLWLEITNVVSSHVYGWIHNTKSTNPYAIFQKQKLLDAAWTPAATFYGAGASTNTPFFDMPTLGRDTLFLWARSQLAPRTITSEYLDTVGIKRDGTVWAWGVNDNGELGNGKWVGSPVPVQVIGLSNIVAVSGSADVPGFALALDSSGIVWSWGSGANGQLGRDDGLYEDENSAAPVLGLSNIVAIAAGGSHSIALKSDGTVWTWGYNYYGELGDGTTGERDYPMPVPSLTNAIAIAAGSYHSGALCADSTVWAWGDNSDGQLGHGAVGNQVSPVLVGGLTNVVALSCGDYHSEALLSNGTVMAWGEGDFGELGNGHETNSSIPVAVSISNIVAIAAGGFDSLALDVNGVAWGWGDGYDYEMGNGDNNDQYDSPICLSNVSNLVAIASGEYSSVGVSTDGRIYQWGQYGYLSSSDTRGQPFPFMYDLYNSRDTAGSGLPDWFESELGLSTNIPDTFDDGLDNYTIVFAGIDPGSPPPLELGTWNFDTTNWLGSAGQVPVAFTNLQIVPDWSSNAVYIGMNAPAFLVYNEADTNISPVIDVGSEVVTQENFSANITLGVGTINFWFKPDWSSANLGGTGPGTNAELIAVGNHSTDFSADYWGLEFDGTGDTLRFSSEGGGQRYIYCEAPVSFASNQWYFVSLTYGASSSEIYTNGQLAGTGTNVAEYPDYAARKALGFNVGSTVDAKDQAFGLFDNLQTFNYPIDAAGASAGYYQALGSPSLQFPGTMFASSNTIDLAIGGVISATVEVLVNDTNFNDAVPQSYYANPNLIVPIELGTTDGVYNVTVGVWTGTNYNWTTQTYVRDTTPPAILPSGYSMTTNQPLLQFTGYATEALSSIRYDLTNNQTTNLNQMGFVVQSDGNTFAGAVSTNWFQCFDIKLAPGLNTITVRCADLAGNVTTNVYYYTLDTSSMTTPSLSVNWPTNGAVVAESTITVKGHVSDPTATITAQVAQNGSTNIFTGVVERDGTFWIDNVDLSSTTNLINITAIDVANQSVTNTLMVQTSPVNITVDPMSGTSL
jgi:alpha-tubulin suppressor-like RCC1 family protein